VSDTRPVPTPAANPPAPLALGCPDCGAQVFVRDRVAICERCGKRWDWRREVKDVKFAEGAKA
jgi:DNA-directed RNA polymerase subunit RPC12/RpoP